MEEELSSPCSTYEVAVALLERVETFGALVIVACAISLMLAAIVAVRATWSGR